MDPMDSIDILVADTKRMEMAVRARRKIAKILADLPDDLTRQIAIGRLVTWAEAAAKQS